VLISFSSAKTGEPASQSRGASPIALSAHAVCACLPPPPANPACYASKTFFSCPPFFPIAQPKEVDEIRIEAITLRHNGLKLGMSLLLHCDGVWSDCTYVLFTTIALVSHITWRSTNWPGRVHSEGLARCWRFVLAAEAGRSLRH
jgi:hypothetical protein